MKTQNYVVGALGIGAGLMFIFDPSRGKRRRALIRDQADHVAKLGARQVQRALREVQNHARGVRANTERLFQPTEISDGVLAGRVRAKLGRIVEHPHSIKTKVENGQLTISGSISKYEASDLRCAMKQIDGITQINDRLDVHEYKTEFGPPQDGRGIRRELSSLLETRWSPPVRVIATIAGAGFALYGLKRRDMWSSFLGSAGLGLIGRSLANKPIENFVPRMSPGISVQKSIQIGAPIKEVFKVCANPEQFPNFMSHVCEVKRLDDTHFQWTVDGIAGFPISWTTQILKVIPDELIRWRSAEDSPVMHFGELRLEKVSPESTRLSVLMRYQPPAGIFGHWVASVFGRDPKSEMDDDILRMKTFIEKGKIPHDGVTEIRARKWRKSGVKEVMTKNPACLFPKSPLYEAADLMRENDCGAIPILENETTRKVVGIITDRDIACRVIAHERNPYELNVGEAMTHSPLTLHNDATIEECRKLMDQYQIRRVVIVDKKGACCGIVSMADIARSAPEHETAELAKEVSTKVAAA